jgi:hypothetical protein
MKRYGFLIPVAALTLTGLLAGGCGNQQGASETSAPTQDKKIADIQNDPNLPPQVKQNIIQNMQQQQQASSASAKANGAAQEAAADAKGAPPK